MDIADWLRDLGLARYDAVFRNNAIDLEILPELTETDLEKLGVLLGHRKRILRAIEDLGVAPPVIATAESAAGRAERRQLTVMFCDLVGSTELSARLDPEDYREVIATYHRAVADVVRSFDGFVAKYMGDGVLVYFGYPQAHEDDADWAVRAGLGSIDAVGRLDLQARVGIATGLVVVGDLIGEGSAQEQSVVGETPNLAARLQALAEPDTSSSLPAHAGWSAISSNTATSALSRSRASPRRCRPGRLWVRAPSPAASRRCAARR